MDLGEKKEDSFVLTELKPNFQTSDVLTNCSRFSNTCVLLCCSGVSSAVSCELFIFPLLIMSINWPGNNVGKYFMIWGYFLATLTCVQATIFQDKINKNKHSNILNSLTWEINK